MKILILGCGGFIGCHLIDALLKDGKNSVTGVDIFNYKISRHLSNPKFEFIEGDIYGMDIEGLVAKSEVVIFLATICNPYFYVNNPLATIKSNFIDPMKIVDMCVRNNVWMINFSSCEIYGKTVSSYVGDDYATKALYEQIEDTTPLVMGPIKNQRWCYASAKQLLDRYIYANHTEKDFEFTSIRPYNFVGSKLDYLSDVDGMGTPRVVACFIEALLKGKPIKLVNGGKVFRTFTYIQDAVDALLIIIGSKEESVNRFFNIANPENEITVEGLAGLMKSTFAKIKGDPDYLNHPVVSVNSDDFYGVGYEDCDRRVPNIDGMLGLGWKPRYGLEETFYLVTKGFLDYYENSDIVKSTSQVVCA
jgi:UDP-apiose/xylose synthase